MVPFMLQRKKINGPNETIQLKSINNLTRNPKYEFEDKFLHVYGTC